MPRKIAITARPRDRRKPAATDNESRRPAEEWVSSAASGRMKRFTIDVPEELHRQIKIYCAQQGIKMADWMRGLAEKNLS